jgi:hypothetical protein
MPQGPWLGAMSTPRRHAQLYGQDMPTQSRRHGTQKAPKLFVKNHQSRRVGCAHQFAGDRGGRRDWPSDRGQDARDTQGRDALAT